MSTGKVILIVVGTIFVLGLFSAALTPVAIGPGQQR